MMTISPGSGARSPFKRIIFPLLAIAIGVVAGFAVLELLFRLLPVCDSVNQLPVNVDNPVIRFEPNRDFRYSHGWNFDIVVDKHSNNYGFLNDQNYDRNSRTPLLAVIGDSYVEANQVANREAFHGVLANAVGNNGRIYSFGASGAPLSSYLAYARYAREQFNPNGLIFVIIGNDFDESLARYSHRSGHYHFAEITPDRWNLVRNDYQISTTKSVVRYSALIRYLVFNLGLDSQFLDRVLRRHPDENKPKYVANAVATFTPERLLDSQKVVDQFFKLLSEISGLPSDRIVFVIDGLRPALYSHDQGDMAAAEQSYAGKMMDYFKNAAKRLQYEVIDMNQPFRNHFMRYDARFEFEADGHWNTVGHSVVAKELAASRLYKKFFGDASKN